MKIFLGRARKLTLVASDPCLADPCISLAFSLPCVGQPASFSILLRAQAG